MPTEPIQHGWLLAVFGARRWWSYLGSHFFQFVALIFQLSRFLDDLGSADRKFHFREPQFFVKLLLQLLYFSVIRIGSFHGIKVDFGRDVCAATEGVVASGFLWSGCCFRLGPSRVVGNHPMFLIDCLFFGFPFRVETGVGLRGVLFRVDDPVFNRVQSIANFTEIVFDLFLKLFLHPHQGRQLVE